MTHECKQRNLKCIEWCIQVPSTDSTLLSESFTIQSCVCQLKFKIELFWVIKCVNFYFKSNGKFHSPIIATVRVSSSDSSVIQPSNSSTILLERYTITDEDHEIWKYKGTSLDRWLIFEVIIHTDPSKDEKPEAETSNHPLQAVSQKSDSTSNSHFEGLSRDFSKLLDENSNCDVEISCDGKSFKAHRIVLGTRSGVFSAMLKSNMNEDKTGIIKVEDFKAAIFQSFLRYLYSGRLPELSLDAAMQFYEISDKYAVEELKQACSEFLIKNLTEDSACEVLILADQHSDVDFRKKIISYIVDKNIPQRTGHWSNFCKRQCNLANEVMLLYIQKHCP